MDLRPVIFVLGFLLVGLAVGMTPSLLIDAYDGNEDWKVFFISILITSFFGGMFVIVCSAGPLKINIRQGFVLAFCGWMVLAVFGTLPLWLSATDLSFTDAFFESVSGITTTGATVINGLESLPRGLLFWRAMLQWLGGIGVVIMALSILPFLKIGGMQIFEADGTDSEKALPRTAALTTSVFAVYVFLTALCAAAYNFSGLGVFDSLTHAMTTLATGGFSNYDNSFMHFENDAPRLVAIVFMILGGLPFLIYIKALHGNIQSPFKDGQVRFFIGVIVLASILLLLTLRMQTHIPLGENILPVLFTVISTVTGTGFACVNHAVWGPFAVALLFFLMAMGGCAGSTSSGIKIFRFQILASITLAQIRQLLYPHSSVIPRYHGKALPKDVPISVMSFFLIYGLCFAGLALALSLTELDFMTSLTGAIASLSNVGPGFGNIIGPSGNYAHLPDSAKWIMSAGMIFGRLELFGVLVLLSPRLWRP